MRQGQTASTSRNGRPPGRPTLAVAAGCTLVALLVVQGCGGPHLEADPLSPSEVEAIAARLDADLEDISAVRISGHAVLSTQTRRSRADFAALYDRPSWLRADARPSSPAAPAGMAAQILAEGTCARMLFPGREQLVTGCMQESPFTDPALLMLGMAPGEDLRRLEAPAMTRLGGEIRITGLRGASMLTYVISEDRGTLESLEVVEEGGGHLSLEFERDDGRLPRVVVLRAGRGDRTEIRLRLEVERRRTVDHIDRKEHELMIPPGVSIAHWGDLTIWR